MQWHVPCVSRSLLTSTPIIACAAILALLLQYPTNPNGDIEISATSPVALFGLCGISVNDTMAVLVTCRGRLWWWGQHRCCRR